MPEMATLTFARPPGFDDMSAEQFAELLAERVRLAEEYAADERRKTGRRILGRAASLRQDWRDRPESREPRRALSPRVAARSKWSRIEALQRNKAFERAYAEARAALVRGLRTIFPAGTYWLRRFTYITCAPCPLAAAG